MPTEAESKKVREALAEYRAAARTAEEHGVTPGEAVKMRPAAKPETATVRPCFYVCLHCNSNFVLRPDKTEASCACGGARVVRYEKANLNVGTAQIQDVTPLVECGKLSAYIDPVATSDRCMIAWHNRPKRAVAWREGWAILPEEPADEYDAELARMEDDGGRFPETGLDLPRKPERTAEERAGSAMASLMAQLEPIAEVLIRSAEMGAQVMVHAHYNVEPRGVQVDDKGAQWQKNQQTGDARYVLQVIARDAMNPPSDSIVTDGGGQLYFCPVTRCARCEGNHPPLAFWRLRRPVMEYCEHTNRWDETASHFAFCPSTGEPILLRIVGDTGSGEAVQANPVPSGPVTSAPPHGQTMQVTTLTRTPSAPDLQQPLMTGVGSMQSIDGPSPIGGASNTVGGVGNSTERQHGREAARRNQPASANPYPEGTASHDEWDTGHREGGGSGHAR